MYVAILGGGPAGLSAGKVLTDRGIKLTIFEKNTHVGGLARTVVHHDFRFDLGGHRFYTKNPQLRAFLEDLFPTDLFTVQRSSKIFFKNRFFDYPLKPLNAFFGMGVRTSLEILAHYLYQKIKPHKEKSRNFEDWIVQSFGRKMFELYFKSYTEKVWGIDCRRISADWASQRIAGLSLKVAILNALGLKKSNTPKTLIESFLYPRYGIGEISRRMAERITAQNQILHHATVYQFNHQGDRIHSITWKNAQKEEATFEATHYLSSIPITEVILGLDPPAPPEVIEAAKKLKFRSLIIVALMFNKNQMTDQSWIYIPDAEIGFGRIHEPNNWSRDMVPEGKSCLVFEYFCNTEDPIWQMAENDLVQMTLRDFLKLKLLEQPESYLIDQCVVRLRNAYPVYEIGFKHPLKTIMKYVSRFKNLTLIGRYGTYKYINMDHSIEMGIKAAENLLGGRHSILEVNTDPSYLEGPPLDSAA